MPPPFAATDEACAHFWDESAMVYPHHQSAVHKEECAYCCRTCRGDAGILVCMCCHTGFCPDHVRKHTSLHSGHSMYVWIRELPPKEPSEDAPKDVNMLGVLAPKEYESAVCCVVCRKSCVAMPESAADFYQQIMHASSAGAKDSMKEDGDQYSRPQCPHLVCLEQLPNPFPTAPSVTEKCSFEGCECRLNNWMCMTCGAVGCPRKEAGGSGHALQHHVSTMHPVVVKMGTVTPSGADFYCYACDDEVSDVHFKAHMLHFGIDILTAKKTAKTLGEMQYDFSSQFDFKRITESGEQLVPVFGSGRTGMHNFGNSCYMSSVLQCLFSLQPFRDAFYYKGETRHQNICRENPLNCRTCQMERVASGLLSGEFSSRDNERSNGITAREFKRVFAQRHPDFSTGEQQDAQEYLQYLLEEMRRHVRLPSMTETSSNSHPVDIFKLIMEHRVQCSSCHKVCYTHESDYCLSLPIPMESFKKPSVDQALTDEEIEASRLRVSLEACIASVMRPTDVECRCGACGNLVNYTKNTRVVSFPDVLVIFLRRAQFDVEKMTVTKLDAFVDVPEQLDLESLRAKGLQADEVEMPAPEKEHTHKPAAAAAAKIMDENALSILLEMGIDEAIARYALIQTDMDAKRAIDYVFSREDIMCEMAEAAGVTIETYGKDNEVATGVRDGPAQYQLHAMISHIGACAKVGHYVCHIRDDETKDWLLFNDEKVAVSRHPPLSMASTYFYVRCAK